MAVCVAPGMPCAFVQPSAGAFHRQLELSQLLPAPSQFASSRSESLLTTLEVRVASLSREVSVGHSIAGDSSGAFEDAMSLLEKVPPLSLLRGIVRPLALDARGCRLLQFALEIADSVEQKELIDEFRGHVREALDSPHANHVLQRAIELVPPHAVQFILDELAGSWDMSSIVQHRFGCRLMERILEHFTACPSARSALDFFLANGAFGDLSAHCHHMFGTHVMQHLMEYGSYEQQLMVCAGLRADLQKAASNEFAVGVLDKALTYLPVADQQVLAREILQRDGLLVRMAMCWRGQPAAERVVRVVEGALLSDALDQLVGAEQALKKSKGGRSVLALATKRCK